MEAKSPTDKSAKSAETAVNSAPRSPFDTGPIVLEGDETRSHDGGLSSYGVVYANDIARRAMMEEKPRFPVGSIIIREKLAQAEDRVPRLLIALVKRERGFNPEANDWEFLLMDGSASNFRLREKSGSCLACHAQQKDKDFVFRSYLPAAVFSPAAPN